MGWASAVYIFDPVAKAMQQEEMPPEIRQKVASILIRVLRDSDWDTEDESLEKFKDDPAIVAAFAEHGITPWAGDDDDD